jgi:hypothetical protein
MTKAGDGVYSCAVADCAQRHGPPPPCRQPNAGAPDSRTCLAAGSTRLPAGSCCSRRGTCWRSGRAPPQASSCTASSEAGGPRRHLDTNGDGLVSETELRAALGELGAGAHAPAAAQELVGLAAGGLGARGVSFADWSQFVRRVRGRRACLPARAPGGPPGSRRPARCLQALPERLDALTCLAPASAIQGCLLCGRCYRSWLCQVGGSAGISGLGEACQTACCSAVLST